MPNDQVMRAPQPTPELGRLKHAAERISIAENKVSNFLIRFNGGGGQTASGSSAGGPAVEDTYRNDLESVFIQIDRLEATVAALDSIG